MQGRRPRDPAIRSRSSIRLSVVYNRCTHKSLRDTIPFNKTPDLFLCYQLRSRLNPDCDETCRGRNVTTLHLSADGSNDTLHYLWDFIGYPSVLLALTPPSTSLNISWEDYLARRENSVRFSEKPKYSFGMIINKVILIPRTFLCS